MNLNILKSFTFIYTARKKIILLLHWISELEIDFDVDQPEYKLFNHVQFHFFIHFFSCISLLLIKFEVIKLDEVNSYSPILFTLILVFTSNFILINTLCKFVRKYRTSHIFIYSGLPEIYVGEREPTEYWIAHRLGPIIWHVRSGLIKSLENRKSTHQEMAQ